MGSRKRKRSKGEDSGAKRVSPSNQAYRKHKRSKSKHVGSREKVPPAIKALVAESGAVVLPLPLFIAKLCPHFPKLEMKKNCTDSQRIFGTWVVSNEPLEELPLTQPTVSESLKDLIDHVVYILVQRREKDWTQRNVLGQGHQSSSNNTKDGTLPKVRECPNMKPGVICFRVNDNINFLQVSSYAKMLHKSIGDELLRVLLLKTCIFLPLTNNSSNFILLCGEHNCAQTARRKYEEVGKSNEKWKPNRCLSRYSLFYSHSYLPKVGLPTSHVLNQNNPNALLNCMVHLYSSKSKKRRRRWARLREKAIPLCKDVLRRHQKCNYYRILNRHCRLPEFCGIQQKNNDLDIGEVGAAHTAMSHVSRFVLEIIQSVFPKAFWGSTHNYESVCVKLHIFIKLRKDERFPIKLVMESLRVTHVNWLWPNCMTSAKRSRTDFETATLLLQSVMRWFFLGFLIPLLRSTFYITESEFSAKRLLYYRKPVWSIFRALGMKKLVSTQYKVIGEREVKKLLETQGVGLSRLKLLPKTTGMRPIAMLSQPENLGQYCRRNRVTEQSTNDKLSNMLEILRYEYERNPERFGAGVSGISQIYPILRSFVKKVKDSSQGKARSDLYFVSVDISKCYDTIRQEHLLGIMEDVIQDDQYLIQQHLVTYQSKGEDRIVRKPLRKIGPLESFFRFHDLATSSTYNDAVFTMGNRGAGKIVKKEDLRNLLAKHLKFNVVVIPGRYGKRYLWQTCGIPQGSKISSFLCNYYYGGMDIELIKKISNSNQPLDNDSSTPCVNVLIRIIDDFILISTDKDCANRFIKKMEEGEPILGANINKEKTLANFDAQTDKSNQPRKSLVVIAGRTFFPWCGVLIDTHTAEVRIDYSRFAAGKSEDALTVDHCHCGRQLKSCIKYYLLPRCQPLLFDTTINGSEVIIINLTQMMLLAAVKSKSYIESAMSLKKNIFFLQRAIDSAILFSRKVIIHRMQRNGGQGTEFFMGVKDTLKIGQYCFGLVLKDLGCNVFPSFSFIKEESKIPGLFQIVERSILQFTKAMQMPNIRCFPSCQNC